MYSTMCVSRACCVIPVVLILNLGLRDSCLKAFAFAVDAETETQPLLSSSTSSWSDWFWPPSSSIPTNENALASISNTLSDEDNFHEENDGLDSSSLLPFSLMSSLGYDIDSIQLAGDVFDMYYNADDTSYMSMLSTLLKLLWFFMPGGGIIQQIYFLMEMVKVTFKVANMYYNGYGTAEIFVSIAPDLLKATMLTRRDEFYATPLTLHAGDSVDVASMNAATFLQYVDAMRFPSLPNEQEDEIREDVTNAIVENFPNIDGESRDSMVDALVRTAKFFALFKPNRSIFPSSNSEEKKVNRTLRFIQLLSSSNPRNFVAGKLKNISNVILKIENENK